MPILIAKSLARFVCVLLLLSTLALHVAAQSTDIAAPSLVRTSEVVGTIAARDLGDPRVTDHFYAFTGTPGDVLITVDSRNLNGDIDVFTFTGLQPLLKFTVYAGSSSAITKSIYLRKQEDLILRVEGRTPNDDEAVYRIHFGGSFAPLTLAPWLSENENATTTPPATVATGSAATAKTGRRVSSVGARIDEPPAEVAEAPTPEPTPDSRSTEPATAAPKTAAAKPKPGNSRVRRPPNRKTPPAETAKTEATAKSESEAKPPAEDPESEKKTPAKRRPPRRTTTARTTKPTPAPAPAQEPEESGPRLLIETNDGTLVDRYMSSVRRVTVENGQVVVVGRDGKVQRISLASVVRMTISP